MKKLFIVCSVYLSAMSFVWASSLVDNFDTLNTSFWDCDVNLTHLVVDPDATGTHGSVVQIMGYSGHVSHTFDSAVYGTISLDYYDNSTSPHQLATFTGTDAAIETSKMIGQPNEGASFIPLLSGNQLNLAMVNRYSGWHTLSLIYGIDSTTEYIDGELLASSDYGLGCSMIYFSQKDMINGNYFDNFMYSPAVVPEPSTNLMMISGLFAGMAIYFKKFYCRNKRA